jgi:hypothetical protein
LTPQTTITERFTRISTAEIAYTFTIEDEVLYARPWTAESLFGQSDDHVLEFACHEGNYSLGNILNGGRLSLAHRLLDTLKTDLELFEFCMHELRWPEVETRLADMQEAAVIASDRNTVFRIARVREVFDDDWSGQSFFRRFGATDART